MQQDDEIKQLVERMHSGQLSDTEWDRLLEYLEDPANGQVIKRWISGTLTAEYSDAPRLAKQANQQLTDRVRERLSIETAIPQSAQMRRMPRYPYPIAAAMIAAMAVISWWFLGVVKPGTDESTRTAFNQSASDSPAAQLILPGGRTIPLQQQSSSGEEGIVVDHTVRYANGEQVLAETVDTLTLITPVGRDYQLTLADGSRVKLNANSRLVYPSRFTGNVRRVKLIGEGFFEINHSERNGKRVPFVIEASDKTIEVLGTVFNISAYPAEKRVTTSLLSGSVRMAAQGNSETSLLKPGQRAISRVGRSHIQVLDSNVDSDIAWTRGVFEFVDEPLIDILQTLSNWYVVEIDSLSVPHLTYTGSLPRNKPLEEVLDILQKTGNIKLATQDNKIIVKPELKRTMSYP